MRKYIMLLAALTVAMALAAPAFAASRLPGTNATIAGRMLTDLGWWQRSEELTTNGDSDVGSIFLNMPNNSYFRTRWRTKDKTGGARIEIGLGSNQPSTSLKLRYAYGWYRLGRCRILAGHTDNWFTTKAYHPRQYLGLNNGNHLLLYGWGFFHSGRETQLQFTWNEKNFGIQFALEEPHVLTSTFPGTDMYLVLPRMSLTAMIKSGGFMSHPGLLMLQRNYEGKDIGSDTFNTWAVVLPLMYKAGGMTVKLQLHYGMNVRGEFSKYPSVANAIVSSDSGNIQDTYNWGGVIALEYKVGKVMVTGGLGMENFENNSWERNGYDKGEVSRWAAFIAVPYQVNKYFGIHPEFSYYSYGDDAETGVDQGTEWLFGAQFRFIF